MAGPTREWTKCSMTIQANGSDRHARFVLVIGGAGAIALDMISLFPEQTFRNRANGLRADLAQAIAELKPKFIRFPGGCLAHGDGLDNMYRWKDTIGPVETRREQPNIWNYHQSVGLGYYEYFQFCEDIGAKPVPVVPAGVCCQNSEAKFTGRCGQGQRGVPLEAMPEYIQEVLDLIEWANGPVTSFWGAKRAQAGHPESFRLEYLGVGNEDHITEVFKERFKLIYEAVKAIYPGITVIGTVGPGSDGADYDRGWEIARELNLEIVDEHIYQEPGWFWENLNRFDRYDRTASRVFLGEYAAHDFGRRNTLRSALAEAAYMTSLERNGDIVRLASYAPLLGKQRHMQWIPDLIYFDNMSISRTINYDVQQLFSLNAGDISWPTRLAFDDALKTFTVSCVQESKSGDIIMKLVSRNDAPLTIKVDLSSLTAIHSVAICTVISGDPSAENTFGQPPAVSPRTSEIMVAQRFTFDVPAHSLSVIRVKTHDSEVGFHS